MIKIKKFLYKNASIEEAMAISAGAFPMDSSNQISGMQLPLGMPKQKKRRKKGTVITASPALHNPDALALKEMYEDLFEFDTNTDRGMARLWADQPDVKNPEQPVKSASPELDKDLSQLY